MNPNGYPQTLTHFTSTYQPKVKGRKPNIMKKYLSGEGRLSKEDIQAVSNYLLSCPREKLQEIVKDPKQPMIMVTLASALIGDMTSKKTTTTDLLMRIAGEGSGSEKGAPELPDNKEAEQFARYEYPELKNVTEGVDPQEKEG